MLGFQLFPNFVVYRHSGPGSVIAVDCQNSPAEATAQPFVVMPDTDPASRNHSLPSTSLFPRGTHRLLLKNHPGPQADTANTVDCGLRHNDNKLSLRRQSFVSVVFCHLETCAGAIRKNKKTANYVETSAYHLLVAWRCLSQGSLQPGRRKRCPQGWVYGVP